jgi:hypothetical protein
MTPADVQQLQYALSKAQARSEELSALLKASNASNDALVEMVLTHEATIARLTAENKRIKPLREMLDMIRDDIEHDINALSLVVEDALHSTLIDDDEAQFATVTEVM